MGYRKDLTGKRFGMLVVVSYAGKMQSGKQKKTMWKCICDCGNEKIVSAGCLQSGHTTSCGCFHKKMVGDINRKHNLAHKCRLYSVWKSMKGRCNNPTDKSYKNYGGRGIKVCKIWQDDFKAFYDWSFSNGYKEETGENKLNVLTIDRIDNDADYCPKNCRWITNAQQAKNKQNTLSSSERYKNCPVCGKLYEKTKRNGAHTCSRSCGAKYRYMVRKNELQTNLCD